MAELLAPDAEVELGAKYRDSISGFEGIATSETRFINKCRQVCLTREVEKGKQKTSDDSWYFDIEQLERVGDGILKKLADALKSENKAEPDKPDKPARRSKGGPARRASTERGRRG